MRKAKGVVGVFSGPDGRTISSVSDFETCCRCGERHAMPLSQRTMRCACGNVMDRDENAAVNLYWYGEEPRNRALLGATRVETGCQAAGVSLLPVPVVETRMLAVMEHASDHECQ